MGRFARSWSLAKASLGVLRSDKELLAFPLLSVLGVVLVAASFLLPLLGSGALAIAVGALALLALVGIALVQAALGGIYSAALYRYAVAGDAPAGFDGVLLRDAFQRKA
jgi:hypothetical protein